MWGTGNIEYLSEAEVSRAQTPLLNMSADDVAWARRRLSVLGEGFDEVAVHLLNLNSAAEMRESACALLGESPFATLFVEELASRKWSRAAAFVPAGQQQQSALPPRKPARQRERNKDAKLGGGAKKTETLPVNCLRCGFVNGVAAAPRSGRLAPEDSWQDTQNRAACGRDEWRSCAACGDALAQQLRFGDCGTEEDASLGKAARLAARLVQFDKESARRTHVIDDQQDWYEIAQSPYSTPAEARHAALLRRFDKRHTEG